MPERKYNTAILLILFTCFVALISCNAEMDEGWEPEVKSRFEERFQKRPIDLSKLLGDSILISPANGVYRYYISYNRQTKRSSILNESKDTVFSGFASRYKGLVYLSESREDSTFWIHAIRISEDGIKGWMTGAYQMQLWDDEFEPVLKGLQSEDSVSYNVLLSVNREADEILLTPYKKELKKFYEKVLSGIAESKLYDELEKDSVRVQDVSENDEEGLNKVIGVYPNPVKGSLNVDLQGTLPHGFIVTDKAGDQVLTGEVNSETNIINLEILTPGMYYVQFFNEENNSDVGFRIQKE